MCQSGSVVLISHEEKEEKEGKGDASLLKGRKREGRKRGRFPFSAVTPQIISE
jgi:hypothetical protein